MFITLYKYVPLEYVVDILDNQRLYLSDGTNFNDPFELTIVNRETNETTLVRGLHILSLTNSYRNKLIWSHYADSHKGVCLTVKIPRWYVYPICYTTRRIKNNDDIDEIITSSIFSAKRNANIDFSALSENKKIAFIKDRKWLYEKEYRVVFDENDEDELIFDDNKWFMPVKITNVYLGVKFDRNDDLYQKNIKEACKRNKVRISQMILSSKNYSLIVSREGK